MDELAALESWAGGLLSKLAPAARRTMTREIARELQRSQRTRIAQQRNPDGTAYEKRKPRPKKHLRDKAGRIKRAAMFAKLRQAHYLRTEADATGLAIGFAGRVARIARVHQYGEIDRVAKGGPQYRYPARVLLGICTSDRDLIRCHLLTYLTR
jgi:phage virion morphogenesis protein